MDIAYKKSFLKWFGQNLKRARKESGYSQESLSEHAGMDLSYYGAVERGERAITIMKLSQITNALGIPMRNLFSGEPNYPLNEKKDRLEELIEFLRERESKDLDLFIDILPKLINWKLSK